MHEASGGEKSLDFEAGDSGSSIKLVLFSLFFATFGNLI